MTALLSGSEHIRPFTSQFAGSITADGQTARVVAIALTTSGKLALLNLVANDTTLSAITATLLRGQVLPFSVAEGMDWDAPTLLGRAEGVSYRLIKAPVPNTRERNYLLLPHTADIGEGIVRPDEIAPPASADGPTAGRTARPPRYVFANHDEPAPNARSFLGHLRTLRVVFLPHWADTLWSEGLAAELITPLPALGVRAWQIASDQTRWQQLVSDAVCARRLTRRMFAMAA